ncbi:MAG: HD domain-containing protein [Candidatus Neomarinimicrobiota bacterium]|jgi:hypothetical protein
MDVVKILPEINGIKDADLKQKVINIWNEAADYRGWTSELLMAIPFTLLAENVSISFIDHVRAVCRMCMAVDDVQELMHGNKRIAVNRDYLIAGALLADVGKLLEYEIVNGKSVKSSYGRYLRHPFSGVGLAFKHDVPEEVMHVIATHSKEGDGEKRSPESIIFHHADFIDFELVK